MRHITLLHCLILGFTISVSFAGGAEENFDWQEEHWEAEQRVPFQSMPSLAPFDEGFHVPLQTAANPKFHELEFTNGLEHDPLPNYKQKKPDQRRQVFEKTKEYTLDPKWLNFINRLTDSSLGHNPEHLKKFNRLPMKKKKGKNFRAYLYNSIAGSVRSWLRSHTQHKNHSPKGEEDFLNFRCNPKSKGLKSKLVIMKPKQSNAMSVEELYAILNYPYPSARTADPEETFKSSMSPTLFGNES